MRKYQVMIVDDEPRVVRYLRELVQADAECEVVLATTNPHEAIVYEGEHPVDLAIVDIEMGPYNGLELVRNFSADTYSIVCTGHRDLGDPSILAGATDFIAKPFDADRLYFSLARFKENRGQAMRYWQQNPAPAYLVVPLADASGAERVPLADILYLYVDDEQTRLVSRSGEARPVHKSMQQLEAMLVNHGFARVHRGYIANMEHATVFHRTKRPTLAFPTDPGMKLPGCHNNRLPVGRRYRANVERYFSDAAR